MQTFRDTAQREWSITIDVHQIKTVRELVKVDLYNLFGDEAKRLFGDPVLLVDTLYVLCAKQCTERHLTDVDFGKALSDGDVLEAAANALIEETLNFFPSSRKKILRATVDKSNELAAAIQEKALAKLQTLSVTDLQNATV